MVALSLRCLALADAHCATDAPRIFCTQRTRASTLATRKEAKGLPMACFTRSNCFSFPARNGARSRQSIPGNEVVPTLKPIILESNCYVGEKISERGEGCSLNEEGWKFSVLRMESRASEYEDSLRV
jgi:hypothetical protein